MQNQPLQNIKLSFKCPKQLDKLQPCNGDWYCDGCHKLVHDFRGMEEAQILDVCAKSNYQMCGMFEAGRIEVLPTRSRWIRWASATMLALGLTGFYNGANGQSKVGNTIAPSKKPADTALNRQSGLIKPSLFNLVENDNVVFGGMEFSPQFPGGEDALRKFVNKHIKYSGGFVGKVYVQFIVERDGVLSHINIVRSGNMEVDSLAIKAIKAMPKWKPAMQMGKPLAIQYVIPVSFPNVK